MIMVLVLIVINKLFLIYLFKKGYTGIILSYLMFFELIPITLFRQIGFPLFGYVFYSALVLFYAVFYFNREFSVEKLNYIFKYKLFWSIIIFTAVMVVQFYYVNIYHYIDLEIPIKYLTRYLPLTLVAILFCKRNKTLNQIGFGLILFGFLYFLILIVDLGFTELSRREMTEEAHASVLGISRLYGMIFIFSFISLFENKISSTTIIYFIGLLFSLYVMLLVSTRQVFIVIPLILLFYYLVTKKIDIKRFLKIIGGFLIVGLMAYVLLISYDFMVLQRMSELLGYQETYRYQRYLFALSTLVNLAEMPLLGFGAGYFSYVTGIGSAHNLFFGMVLEYGLLGFIAWLFLIVGGLITVFKLLRSNHLDFSFKVIPLFWLIYALTTFVSGDSTGARNLWVLTGLLISLKYFNEMKSINFKYFQTEYLSKINYR